jgi:hypothetical protein
MKYIKNYKVFESDKFDIDIEYVRDILMALQDLGFFVNVNLTPHTLAGKLEKPEFYIDIQKPNDWLQFYDDDYTLVNKHKDFIDSTILHALEYLEERGYKMRNIYHNKPTMFNFKNNPTSYQLIFTK